MGNRFAILQDAPNSFHVTLQGNELVLYEHFTLLQSKEDILNHIHRMEQELYPKLIPEKTGEYAVN